MPTKGVWRVYVSWYSMFIDGFEHTITVMRFPADSGCADDKFLRHESEVARIFGVDGMVSGCKTVIFRKDITFYRFIINKCGRILPF